MADPSEARNHPVDQNDDARLNLTGTELQAMIDIAVNNTVDRALKNHKRKCDDTPNKGYKKGKTGSNYNQSKPKEAKPECKVIRDIQATFNTRRLSDKEYLPDLESKINEVCEASLAKVVEMKKKKEEELKKMVEEMKDMAKNDVEEEQKMEEKEKKEEDQKGETEESLVLKETEENESSDLLNVLKYNKDCQNANKSSLALEKEEDGP
ncbi:protein MNN4-like [Helianthus annuus]|uniref:protein MNN4-like n=1 Tax=Helianthus annuus TaxID=4232 RepID=UPI000B900750|nr:protein MNN4-like [Helianthus annuus]